MTAPSPERKTQYQFRVVGQTSYRRGPQLAHALFQAAGCLRLHEDMHADGSGDDHPKFRISVA